MKTRCDVIRDLLPLYMDDIASDDSRALVEEHLAECEDCRNYLKELKESEDVPVSRKFANEMKPLKKIRRREIFTRVAVIIIVVAFVILGAFFLSTMLGGGSMKLQDHADYTVPEGYEQEGVYYDDSEWEYIRKSDDRIERLKIWYDDYDYSYYEEEKVDIGNGWEAWICREDENNYNENRLSGVMKQGDDQIILEYICQIPSRGYYYDSCSDEQVDEMIAFMKTIEQKDPPPAEGNVFKRLLDNLGLGGLIIAGVMLLILIGVPVGAAIGSLMGDGKESKTGDRSTSSRDLHGEMNEERKARGENTISAINNMGGISTNNLARKDKSWSSVPDFFIKLVRRK